MEGKAESTQLTGGQPLMVRMGGARDGFLGGPHTGTPLCEKCSLRSAP